MALEAADVWDSLIAKVQDQQRYTTLEEYFKGEQELALDPTELNSKFGKVFATFRDNLARPIIEAADGRVRIVDFGNGEGLGADADAAWLRNNMNEESKWVHKEAMIKGDGYVIVLPDQDGKGGIYPQISEQIAVLPNDVYPRLTDAAVKWWVESIQYDDKPEPEDFIRVNLYFEDRIERYIALKAGQTLDADFAAYAAYSDAETDAVSKHDVGEVPVYQFSPNYLLSDGAGVSDLEDALPMLDLINKTFIDMAVASEFTAAPQRWATGVEIPVDPKTGKPKSTFKAGGDTVWTAANDAASFGQFQAGSMSGFKEAMVVLLEQLAVVSRTPMYYLMSPANWPTGEMLKSSEGALRQRVQDHQEAFGPVWVQVLAAVLTLDKITVEPEQRLQLVPQWLPPNAPFATREHLEELKVHVEVLGIPEEMMWRKAGYSQAEILEMKAMREEESALGLDIASELQAQAIIDEAAGNTPASPAAGLASDAGSAPNPLTDA